MAEKQTKAGGVHEGHRQRMKERFLTGGLDSFSDHEIVELLLFYALPYRNTNDLAHALVEYFGSWTRVLNAHYDDLLLVPGVTPHVATLLTLVGQSARKYYKDMTGVVQHLFNTQSLIKHVVPQFLGAKNEKVIMVCLDNKRKHLNTTCLFEGNVNSAQFNVREAVQQALRDNATQLVLAHNHPNGFAFPSNADVETTRRLMEILRPLDIRLIEHIVVAEGDCLCMTALPETKWLFDGTPPPPGFAKVANR
ncbi:MAG: hypothetical protein E7527_03265 [Ruminococcaceae bacterium]|nr:hypothetical protein [Oscillospiraceae bacterium]